MKAILAFIRRFAGQIFTLLNIGAIIWLALCVAAAYTDPEEVKYIALFGLSTPFAVLANVMFALAWIIFSTRRKFRALLSLLALVASYKVLGVLFGMHYFPDNDMAAGTDRIKVLHWNAHGMGIFDNPVYHEQEQDMIAYMQDINADVICLPEFPVPKSKIMTDAAKKIMETNGYKDYRFQADNTLGKNIFLGTAVFSKYPIHNYKSHRLSSFIYMMQADVVPVTGDTTRMFFLHLNTFGLSDDDKEYIEEISKSEQSFKKGLHRSTTFIDKFNYAFVRRSRQIKAARKIIDQSPYPVILCGDFNDLPGSYTYTHISEHLTDAFLQKSHGLGRTYNQLVPTLRIDFVFYDEKKFNCIGYRSKYSSLSDHNPVIVNLQLSGYPQG